MKQVFKLLVAEGVLDFSKLVMRYYHKLNLNENEAIALIKLHHLLMEKQGIIKPEKFSKWLSKTPKETTQILESLMEKGFLKITTYETTNGKEQETFTIDYFIDKVIHYLDKKASNAQTSYVQEVVEFIEDTLQKPLSPLDIELVTEWLEDDQYSYEMIKEATLEVLKRKYPSVRMIDQILVKKLDAVQTSPKKKDVLKEFHQLWEE